MRYTTYSVEETRSLGKRIAGSIGEGDIVVFNGELGCGKTEFVRGLVESFDCDVIVRSPSFSIVNTYSTDTLNIYHFDFYRLEHANELNEIGFEEYCNGNGLCLIEWGLMFPEVLPPHTIIVTFDDPGDNMRYIEIPFDI